MHLMQKALWRGPYARRVVRLTAGPVILFMCRYVCPLMEKKAFNTCVLTWMRVQIKVATLLTILRILLTITAQFK